MPVPSPAPRPDADLLSAPLELAGDWGKMIPNAARQVLEFARRACLDDVRLVSDRQPRRLRVDEHRSGSPAVWLHPDGDGMAWVIVNIGQQAWSQLAYQFGHELGHVTANSWLSRSTAKGQSEWLEEALVEAFSLRGLKRLAATWEKTPPFPGDNAYGKAIADYRRKVEADYRRLADQQGAWDTARWYAANQAQMALGGLSDFARAAALLILAEYERRPTCVEALGALNRWPERGQLPLGRYLDNWQASCGELGASDTLPRVLRSRLRPA